MASMPGCGRCVKVQGVRGEEGGTCPSGSWLRGMCVHAFVRFVRVCVRLCVGDSRFVNCVFKCL